MRRIVNAELRHLAAFSPRCLMGCKRSARARESWGYPFSTGHEARLPDHGSRFVSRGPTYPLPRAVEICTNTHVFFAIAARLSSQWSSSSSRGNFFTMRGSSLAIVLTSGNDCGVAPWLHLQKPVTGTDPRQATVMTAAPTPRWGLTGRYVASG